MRAEIRTQSFLSLTRRADRPVGVAAAAALALAEQRRAACEPCARAALARPERRPTALPPGGLVCGSVRADVIARRPRVGWQPAHLLRRGG